MKIRALMLLWLVATVANYTRVNTLYFGIPSIYIAVTGVFTAWIMFEILNYNKPGWAAKWWVEITNVVVTFFVVLIAVALVIGMQNEEYRALEMIIERSPILILPICMYIQLMFVVKYIVAREN